MKKVTGPRHVSSIIILESMCISLFIYYFSEIFMGRRKNLVQEKFSMKLYQTIRLRCNSCHLLSKKILELISLCPCVLSKGESIIEPFQSLPIALFDQFNLMPPVESFCVEQWGLSRYLAFVILNLWSSLWADDFISR